MTIQVIRFLLFFHKNAASAAHSNGIKTMGQM